MAMRKPINLKLLSCLAVLALFFGLWTSAPVAAQTWQELGPAPISNFSYTGRASALALSTSQRNRYYVGGASAGVWESRNGGNTWRPRVDELPILAIGALALDPNDESILYAGSGEANYAYHSLYGLGLYKSTDRGRTWRPVDGDLPDVPVSSVAVHKEGSDRFLLAGTDNGVYLSSNGGRSWRPYGTRLPRAVVQDVVVDLAHQRLLVSTLGRGVWTTRLPRTGDGRPGPVPLQ